MYIRGLRHVICVREREREREERERESVWVHVCVVCFCVYAWRYECMYMLGLPRVSVRKRE